MMAISMLNTHFPYFAGPFLRRITVIGHSFFPVGAPGRIDPRAAVRCDREHFLTSICPQKVVVVIR